MTWCARHTLEQGLQGWQKDLGYYKDLLFSKLD